MLRNFAALLVALACALAASVRAQAQLKKGTESSKTIRADPNGAVRVRLNNFRNHMLQVDVVRDKNTVILRDSGRAAPGLEGNWIDVTEGGYVGIVTVGFTLQHFTQFREGALDKCHLFRAKVESVQDDGAVVVKVGETAAATLKATDRVLFFRPPGMSTTQLQRVPDWISLAETRVDVALMARFGIKIGDGPNAREFAFSKYHLKRIGLALAQFGDKWNYFPPAIIYGPDGRPWHSWRVLILPFLGESELYDQYKFDEPWNGPHNSKLLPKMPSCYSDPIYGENKDYSTHYAAIVGKGTAFPDEGMRMKAGESSFQQLQVSGHRGSGRTSLRDFTDGLSNCVYVGSVSPARKIPWMKPEDIAFGPNFPAIGAKDGFAAPYGDENNAVGLFLFADGAVQRLPQKLSIETLRNLLTISDGKMIKDLGLDPRDVASEQAAMVAEQQHWRDLYDGPRTPVIVFTRGKGGAYLVKVEHEPIKPLSADRQPVNSTGRPMKSTEKRVNSTDQPNHPQAVEFLNREGKATAEPVTIPAAGNEWKFVEGATKARMVLRFTGITESTVTDVLVLTLPLKIVRDPYQPLGQRSLFQVVLVNDAVPLRFDLDPVFAGDAQDQTVIIPRTLSKSMSKSKDLFSDFVVNGTLNLEVSGLDESTMFGFQPPGIMLRSSPGTPPVAALEQEQKGDKNTGDSTSVTGDYSTVIAAIKRTQVDYAKAVFTFDNHGTPKRGILVEDEVRLHRSFVTVCKSALAAMSEQDRSKQTWFEMGVVRMLDNSLGDPLSSFHKSGNESVECLRLAIASIRDGDLDRAKKVAERAFQGDLTNVYAYALLKEIYALNAEELKVDTSRIDQKQLGVASEVLRSDVSRSLNHSYRTLPWNFVLPVEARLDKVNMKISATDYRDRKR